MCGITGIWWRRPPDSESASTVLQGMCDAIRHRGPDDSGLWMNGGLGFGHRRLAIVDLSPSGHQPMASSDGRFVICFNGEVFNYVTLRDELAERGHSFSGGSDTEVMLAAIMEWGLEAAVRRFVGMFAFALWDSQERRLHLVRDRVGVKPLYVARTVDGDVLFGSELKCLMAHPAFPRRMNVDALHDYLRYLYVPAPLTVFADAFKLLPGHILSIGSTYEDLRSRAYWSLEDVAHEGAIRPVVGDQREIVDQLEALLLDSVKLRMLADVPLGAFLSGGIDSSLVVALMQSQASFPVKTFTIGFEESRFDESAHARSISAHLGTEHTEQVVTSAMAQAVIPDLPTMFDEPMADASQIPTFLVSSLARSRVTVALSGDGGDELFGGYARYGLATRLWAKLRPFPPGLRRLASSGLNGVSRALVGDASQRRARRAAAVVSAVSFDRLYRELVSTGYGVESILARPRSGRERMLELLATRPQSTEQERMLFADTSSYLPDDLLTKLDRTSMAVALEGRVPLLDHRVVEFAWRLHPQFRREKQLLKSLLSRYVPRSLFERPKMGFEVPIGPWLSGPLKEWASDMLAPDSIDAGGVLSSEHVTRVWREYTKDASHSPLLIWAILMLESWRKHWRAHV